MAGDYTRYYIIDAIGSGRSVLRVRRDSYGLITDSCLVHLSDMSETFVAVNDATMITGILGNRDMNELGKLTANRYRDKLGFLDLGLPDDGSEYWVMLQ